MIHQHFIPYRPRQTGGAGSPTLMGRPVCGDRSLFCAVFLRRRRPCCLSSFAGSLLPVRYSSFGSLGRSNSNRRGPVQRWYDFPPASPAPRESGFLLRGVGRLFSGIFRVGAQQRAKREAGAPERTGRRRRAACISVSPVVHTGPNAWKSTGWPLRGRSVLVSLVCGWSPPSLDWSAALKSAPRLLSDSSPRGGRGGDGSASRTSAAAPVVWDSFHGLNADLLSLWIKKMMGFLRRTFSRRSRSRFQTRERDERDGKARGGGAGEGGGVTGNPLLLAHQQQVVHAPAVVSAGASVHIPAAGAARTVISCRVLLLDGSDVNVDLPVSADSVCLLCV